MDSRKFLGSSNYIKTADLQGQSVTVTIREAVEEKVGQGADVKDKLVLYFDNKDKGLVLNATNIKSINKAYGTNTDMWPRRQIELYPSETLFGGETVDCTRVRIPRTIPEPAALAESNGSPTDTPPADEIPF